MKTKITITIMLGLLTLAFIYNFNTQSPEISTQYSTPVYTPNDVFLINAMDNAWDLNLSYQNELGMNVWHKYCGSEKINGKHYPTGWTFNNVAPGDKLFAGENNYISDVQKELQNISDHGMKTMLCRPKIEYLCYGQRSDYRCVDTTLIDTNYRFYSFQSPFHPGQDIPDIQAGNGSQYYVRYCRAGNSTNGGNWVDNAGMVVSRLRINSEQCNRDTGDAAYRSDSECDWYIKPRIRIDSMVAHSVLNPLVCNIKVIAQDRFSVLKDINIHANDFLTQINGQYFYNGKYLEEFNLPYTDTLKIHGDWLGTDNIPKWAYKSRDNHNTDWDGDNHADIQVYWYGNCDMWIDYVRVDNDIAHNLFGTGQTHDLYMNWLKWETEDVACYSSSAWQFYIELFEFNQIPCIAYVNHHIDSIAQMQGKHFNVVADQFCFFEYHMNYDDRGRIVTPERIKSTYFDRTGSKQVYAGDPYPLAAVGPGCMDTAYAQFSRIPNTLTLNSGERILAQVPPASPANYDAWLQSVFDTACTWYEGGKFSELEDGYCCPSQLKGSFIYLMKHGHEVSKKCNIPFYAMLQEDQWVSKGEVEREPTNEELNVMTNIAVSYGARGIFYWWYGGRDWGDCDYTFGFVNGDQTPRRTNFYGQAKWDTIKSITNRLKLWGPALMSFDDLNRNSYIYRLEDERNALLSHSCFSDIVTWKPGSAYPPCVNDNPDSLDAPPSMVPDCVYDRYLQVATFRKNNASTNQYFMLVNRRCSPYLDAGSDDHNGGRRYVKASFNRNSNDLQGPNNWNIVNVATNKTSATFNKNSPGYTGIDTLYPGEGKLYQLVPTIIKGGTLLADEVIDGESITIEDTVWSNGHNITITGNSTISFSDSAIIIMNGGTFQVGDYSQGSTTNKNTFQGTSGHKWCGLQFNGTNVKIYNSQFQDISSPVGGNYAVNCINCPLNDIRYNIFISSSDTAGGVNITYANMTSLTGCITYIMSNTFAMNNSYSRAVQLQNYAGVTLGAYIENNLMSSNDYATGILTSTLTGGVIKNNTISGFATGINTLLSSCDLYGNTITNTAGIGTGISAADLCYLNMAPTGDNHWIAGENKITNAGNGSVNLDIDNSAFYLLNGYNTFDVDTTKTPLPNHLQGSFWEGDFNAYIQCSNNCFKLSGNVIGDPDQPRVNVTDFNSNPVGLNFSPYTCDGTLPTSTDIVDIGNGLYDTIPVPNGLGGGESSVQSPKIIYDSLKVQIRHRNYSRVKNLCYEMINNYPDSSYSIPALQSLYFASINTDTSQISYGSLKTYYETLILNHPSNGAMVKISNYLVQKCKVLLRQYSSALAGFQEIINNNQYNYEGLLARWDYMATSLLMNGGGGGDNGIENEEQSDKSDQFDKFDEPDGDKTPFTKEQRVAIRKSVSNTLNDSRSTDEKKINTLIEKEKNGDATAHNELRQKMALKNTIKTVKPKNIIEHIKIVNGDIQRIFGDKNPLKTSPKNLIPIVFNLYQSYPNPFNPTATIKYDLPKDVKVTIKIYDILGRMVKKLVDEFKQAGSYQVRFDGTNLASGVYFYQIEAGEYVNAKKMVLVK